MIGIILGLLFGILIGFWIVWDFRHALFVAYCVKYHMNAERNSHA